MGTVFKMGPRLKLEGKCPRPAIYVSAQFKVPLDIPVDLVPQPECLVLAPVSVQTTRVHQLSLASLTLLLHFELDFPLTYCSQTPPASASFRTV